MLGSLLHLYKYTIPSICTLYAGLSQCTSGFTTMDRLTDLVEASAANLINDDDITGRFGQQRVVPGITFTCDGTITKWIVHANFGLLETPVIENSLEVQVWRSIGVNVYTKVAGCGLLPAEENDNDIYECVPDPPTVVRPGDIFGLFQPASRTIIVQYAMNRGPPNYFIRADGAEEPPDINFTLTAESESFNDLPIVAVEVGKEWNIVL